MKKINLLFVSLLLVGCNNNNSSSNRYSGAWQNILAKSFMTTDNVKVEAFNTVMTLKYFIEESVEDKESLINDVTSIYQDNVSDYHKKFDRHYSYYLDHNDKEKGLYTNIRDVNKSLDSGKFVKLNEDTYNLLKFSVDATKYSECYFNIFVGELTDFWDDMFSNYSSSLSEEEWIAFLNNEPYYNETTRETIQKIVDSIPSTSEEVNQVIEFNDETKEVRFNSLKDSNGESKGKISISVGGVAKGYATDLLKEKLLEKGYDKGYLFSGASSILSLGEPIYNNSKGQALSVLDPRTSHLFGEQQKKAFSINLKDAFSMSTSGNYTSGKSYTFKDLETNEIVTRHHIINSFTGYPKYEDNVASVSVFSKKLSAGLLDVFSTALVNKSIEDGLEFRKKVMNDYEADLEIVYILEDLDKNTIEIVSTSTFNDTLVIGDQEGVSIRYES